MLKKSEEIAHTQIGITESSNRNDGKEIEKYQKTVGIPKFSAYCYAGQYYCFKAACDSLKIDYKSIPIPKSGLANSCFNFAVKIGKKQKYFAEKYDLLVWIHSNNINGHIERIYRVGQRGWVATIAFNTSQNGKHGVFFKKRNIYHFLGRLKIRGLVGFYA